MAPTTPVSTITSTHTSLFPALNIESSGTLTTSTSAQNPDDEGGQREDDDDDDGGSV